MNTLTVTLTTVAALGSATFGGAMFAFSAFVMHGLDRATARSAVEAMQQINLSAPRPPLVLVMLGTTMVSLAVGVLAVVDVARSEGGAAAWLALVGCGGFLASIVITGRFHIPRNDALADIDAAGPDAGAAWAAYSGPWQRGNHVRSACALAAAALMVLSLAG